MNSKDDKHVSTQYKIEKASVKQQKLEDHLDVLSKDLKRSKRNSFLGILIFFLFLIGGLGALVYYWKQNELVLFKQDTSTNNTENLQSTEIRKVNDSLQQELQKLKVEIADVKKSFEKQDSIENTGTQSSSLSETSEEAQSSNGLSTSNEEEKPGLQQKHGYIKRVYNQDGVAFIEVDYLEYFEGKKAVIKAKENGDAEFDISNEGDTLYFLYQNYYIDNKSAKTRILELDSKVKIRGLNQISTGFSLKAFEAFLDEQPLFKIKVSNGITYEIEKQKL